MDTRQPLPQIEVAGATRRFKVSADPETIAIAWQGVPDSVWNDPRIVFEPKEDGHRFKLHVTQDCNRFDSRGLSVNGGLFVEKTDHVSHLRDYPMPDLVGSVFDGELVAGKDSNAVAHALGSLASTDERLDVNYVVFDILFYKGRDVRPQPDEVRRGILDICFRDMSIGECPNILLVPRPVMTPEEKKQRLVAALLAGSEGIMLKDTRAPYGKGWTKVKREATYDVIVMGYSPPKQKSRKKGDVEETITKRAANGWVGAIKFGQYVDGTLVEFGQTSGMTDALLQEISLDKEAFLGRVMEISAQERFPSGKFRHPRFKRWRTDKSARDCVYRKDEV